MGEYYARMLFIAFERCAFTVSVERLSCEATSSFHTSFFNEPVYFVLLRKRVQSRTSSPASFSKMFSSIIVKSRDFIGKNNFPLRSGSLTFDKRKKMIPGDGIEPCRKTFQLRQRFPVCP